MNLRDSLRKNPHSEFIRKDGKYILSAQQIEQSVYSGGIWICLESSSSWTVCSEVRIVSSATSLEYFSSYSFFVVLIF